MIKRYILFVFTVVAIVLGGCKKKPTPIVITPDIEKNHLERNHIFGKVKSLETETFNLQRDSLSVKDTADLKKLLAACDSLCDVPDYSSSSQRYTSDGYLLEFVKHGHIGNAYYRTYTYDNEARITAWNEYGYDSTLVSHGTYTYDRNGFLVGEKVYQGDSLVMSFAHTTDGIGNYRIRARRQGLQDRED